MYSGRDDCTVKSASLIRLTVLLVLAATGPAHSSQMDREQSVRDAVSAFAVAYAAADVVALEAMLTEDYVHVNGRTGNVIGREAWLEWVASRRVAIDRGGVVITWYLVDEVNVVVQTDAAVVTGVVHSRGKKGGRPFASHIRFTNTWIAEGGVWRRASFHDSPLPEPGLLEAVAELRLAGKLEAAREAAEEGLRGSDLNAREELLLRLELAKILDRVGLHTNTRPVAAALEEIERADALTGVLSSSSRGAVALAKANWYYRAEMVEREFPLAEEHAVRAMAMFHLADDARARSDAVHQLGLIYLQRRELDRARVLFDESLGLDRNAGERKWMLGEYHRHVGFIYVLSDDWEAALPHFEKSLRYRKEAGAIDASLFAAVSLGTALVRTGSAADAEPYLLYAITIAQEIPSPVGKARASIILGEMYEEVGDRGQARSAYEAAMESAASVQYTNVEARAREALKRLDEGR